MTEVILLVSTFTTWRCAASNITFLITYNNERASTLLSHSVHYIVDQPCEVVDWQLDKCTTTIHWPTTVTIEVAERYSAYIHAFHIACVRSHRSVEWGFNRHLNSSLSVSLTPYNSSARSRALGAIEVDLPGRSTSGFRDDGSKHRRSIYCFGDVDFHPFNQFFTSRRMSLYFGPFSSL